MSKNIKAHASRSQQSQRAVKVKGRALKRCVGTGQYATPKKLTRTSERIIKETSVKRRKAMQVLANS